MRELEQLKLSDSRLIKLYDFCKINKDCNNLKKYEKAKKLIPSLSAMKYDKVNSLVCDILNV